MKKYYKHPLDISNIKKKDKLYYAKKWQESGVDLESIGDDFIKFLRKEAIK